MFKVEVRADSSRVWSGNALIFASELEAFAYARDLAARWTVVGDYRIVRIDTPEELVS
jgi:hypothetical protein